VNARIPAEVPAGNRMRLELRSPFSVALNTVDLVIR